MDGLMDGATGSLHVSPDSSTPLAWSTTSHAPLQSARHRARRSHDPGNGEITTIAQIESRLKARYDVRQACMPECEQGTYWTWITYAKFLHFSSRPCDIIALQLSRKAPGLLGYSRL